MSDEKQKPTYEDRWTVRGVGGPERTAAARMADKAGQTMGEWLTQAIRDRIQAEKAGTNVPDVVRLPTADTADNGLETAKEVAEQIRGLAAAGVPISERQAAKVVAALNRCLPRVARRQTGSDSPHQQQYDQYDDNQPETAADAVMGTANIPASSAGEQQ